MYVAFKREAGRIPQKPTSEQKGWVFSFWPRALHINPTDKGWFSNMCNFVPGWIDDTCNRCADLSMLLGQVPHPLGTYCCSTYSLKLPR